MVARNLKPNKATFSNKAYIGKKKKKPNAFSNLVVDPESGTLVRKEIAKPQKAPVVIGVGTDSKGDVVVENVGSYLTEEQRREASRLTSEKGRLTTESLSRSTSTNTQGREVVSQSVQFSYKEKAKSDAEVLVSPTNNTPPAYVRSLAEKRFRETPLALKVTIEGWVFTKSAPVKPTRVPIDSQGSITEAESQRGEGLYNRLVNKEERLLSDVEASDARQESSLGTGALLFGVGAVKGVVGVGKAVVGVGAYAVKNPRDAFLHVSTMGLYTVGKHIVKNPTTFYVAPVTMVKEILTTFVRNPAGFIGEVVAVAGVGKVVGVLGKSAIAKFKAPQVVSESVGQTTKTELATGEILGEGASTTVVRSGSKKFRVEAKTSSVDRVDLNDARLQSSTTDLSISKLSKKGDYVPEASGFSRSETVASLTDDGVVLARGDTVQATNVGSKSFTRQGDFVAVGESSSQGTRLTSVSSTGKAVKGSPVASADDLRFVADGSKKVTAVESSSSTKVFEYDAPRSSVLETPLGEVKVSSGAPLKHTVYDDVSSARGGSYLTDAEKVSNIRVDPYGQTTSQGGVSVSYKTSPSGVSPSPLKPAVSSDSALASSQGGSLNLAVKDGELVLSAKTNVISTTPLSTPSSSAQALSAVEDVVAPVVKSSQDVVSVASRGVAPSVISASRTKVVSPVVVASSVQDSSSVTSQKIVASPVLAVKSKSKTKVVQVTKTFSSTKLVVAQKVQTESVLVSRSKSRSKLALASKVVQAVDVVQDVVQDTVLVPVTSQKIFPVSDFVSQRVVPQQLIISTVVASPSSPFERSSSSSSGFDVFVRKRGVFSKINKGALTRVGARDLGAFNVSNTPQATFTLRRSSGVIGSTSSRVRGSFSLFRSNFQQKGGLFIEKRSKRIKSSGEKAGITRLGILANKQKGLFKGLKI